MYITSNKSVSKVKLHPPFHSKAKQAHDDTKLQRGCHIVTTNINTLCMTPCTYLHKYDAQDPIYPILDNMFLNWHVLYIDYITVVAVPKEASEGI